MDNLCLALEESIQVNWDLRGNCWDNSRPVHSRITKELKSVFALSIGESSDMSLHIVGSAQSGLGVNFEDLELMLLVPTIDTTLDVEKFLFDRILERASSLGYFCNQQNGAPKTKLQLLNMDSDIRVS